MIDLVLKDGDAEKTAYLAKNIGDDPPTETIMRRNSRDLAENHAPDGLENDSLDNAAIREPYTLQPLANLERKAALHSLQQPRQKATAVAEVCCGHKSTKFEPPPVEISFKNLNIIGHGVFMAPFWATNNMRA